MMRSSPEAGDAKLLDVRNLKTYFFTERGVVRAIDGVTFALEEGKTLGMVGESGCGKSITAFSIMRLQDPGRIVAGEIWYRGRNLLLLSQRAMRRLRGAEIAMIFQEPMTSLNPVFTIGNQIDEAIKLHQGLGRRARRDKTVEMLRMVEIPEPERRLKSYPHELSGGMRQRVMIAMALSCNPRMLIADEPTTALDVTIQAEILDLLATLQKGLGMALLLISHDLGIVAHYADDVIVMYAGRVVERAPVAEIFDHPLHPYTIGLLNSLPKLEGEKKRRLDAIPGTVPNPLDIPSGCPFRDRCPRAIGECAAIDPPLEEKRRDHWAACIRV